MHELSPVRSRAFEADCLVWLTLHHLLPADHLRELLHMTVAIASDRKLSLTDLFDEHIIGNGSYLSSWALKPVQTPDALRGYLQRVVRNIVWQHDAPTYPPNELSGTPDKIGPQAIENALLLGRIDLSVDASSVSKLIFPPDSKAQVLSELISFAGRSVGKIQEEELCREAAELSESFGEPLRTLALKHIADLYADADEWKSAYSLYSYIKHSMLDSAHEEWRPLFDLIQSNARQGQAACLRTTEGPETAGAFLKLELRQNTFAEFPLIWLNGSHDQMVAEMLGAKSFPTTPDERASILLTPPLLSTHDLSSALQYCAEKNYAAATQEFWATLRRQIALGSAADTRITKAFYARHLFEEAAQNYERHEQATTWWLATRLIIESGNSDACKHVAWSVNVVKRYVDLPLINRAIQHSNRYDGSKAERNNVIVELFKVWADSLAPDNIHIAQELVHYITDIAEQGTISFFGELNLGGRSLELLCELATARPELRGPTASRVADLVVARLSRSESWKAHADVLRLAAYYFDVFSNEHRDQVLNSILTLLDRLDPTKDFWPIIRPAMDILMSSEMAAVSSRNPAIGKRAVGAILRFGLRQSSQHGRLLMYLQNFEPQALTDPETLKQLDEAIREVRSRAQSINSTDAAYNICALLYGSRLSGFNGVYDALSALKKILQHAIDGRPPVSFSYAYDALNVLAAHWVRISSDIQMGQDFFLKELGQILELVFSIWKKAEVQPLIFSGFSIPPTTRPNSTLVHNWAFCSLQLSQAMGRESEMRSALQLAEQSSELRSAINSGRLALFGADHRSIEPEVVKREDAETFYASLGGRLAALMELQKNEREKPLRLLLDECLRRGPNSLDLGVFLFVPDLDISEVVKSHEYSDYTARLGHAKYRELRQTLAPVLGKLNVRADAK